jgi:uncharacterized integral membrane protein (TIGR00698 family)
MVTAGAEALTWLERLVFGHAWLESLVIAILLGAAVRTFWAYPARWKPGVDFSAKLLLEIAVVLLGASVSARALAACGPALLAGVAGTVVAAIAVSYGLCRLLGLPKRMATLVACGNSICGNSAIAAVAPVIGADGEEVATAIAFTAVLGMGTVLGLPVLGSALHMDAIRYGALAGLTVYAVPQVLAAAAPMGPAAVQFGTLVKLVRVLMLGPVCLLLGLATARTAGGGLTSNARPKLSRLIPWFIVGFLVLMGLRSAGALPSAALSPIGWIAGVLTSLSLAALGLSTDLRAVARAGLRVSAAVALSLVCLGGISLGLIAWVGLR